VAVASCPIFLCAARLHLLARLRHLGLPVGGEKKPTRIVGVGLLETGSLAKRALSPHLMNVGPGTPSNHRTIMSRSIVRLHVSVALFRVMNTA
jgi:hypothetical protein